MPNEINYLDIQLRDMDYLKHYGNIVDKFMDTDGWYVDEDEYVIGFEKAKQEAFNSLNTKMSKSKAAQGNPILQILYMEYNTRIKKEQKFVKEWCASQNDKKEEVRLRKLVKFPMNGNPPNMESVRAYANGFSQMIKEATGEQGDWVLAALRSTEVARSMAGESSKVFSTRAANKANQGKGKQSDINKYYEDLFSTFFFGPRGGKIAKGHMVSLQDMSKNGKNLGNSIFRNKFNSFIRTYYPEISSKVTPYLTNALSNDVMDSIYQNFTSNQYFKMKKQSNTRGVSEDVEKQLKKMLLETLRQIVGTNGDFSQFEIPGLLEIKNDWRTSTNTFQGQVQVEINRLRGNRSDARKAGKDMRTYNRTYAVDTHDDDAVQPGGQVQTRTLRSGRTSFIQVKELFLSFLFDKLDNYKGIVHNKLTDEQKKRIEDAVFRKLDGYIKRGDAALQAMSAFGPEQMRGLLGKIATAYAIKNSKGISQTGITGAEKSSAGTGQVHYDVVAKMGERLVGFQVKNYTTKNNSVSNLYETSVGLGRKEMYKYFDEKRVKGYRWIVANGLFLSSAGYMSEGEIRQKLTTSLYSSLSSFLRITDMSQAIDEAISSDIFVIGNNYFPASFLIANAIDNILKNEKAKDSKEMFSFQINFPKYKKKEVQTVVDENGNTSVIPKNLGKNLVWIEKSKMFGGTEIHFNGVTLKF